VWLAAAGLAAGAGVAWLISQADPSQGTIPEVPLALPVAVLVGWSLIGSGLLAARSRREDHLALALIFTGFAWFASILPLSHNSVLFTAGEVLYSLYYAGFLYLILSFPAGRLQGKLDRTLMGIAIALVTVGHRWIVLAAIVAGSIVAFALLHWGSGSRMAAPDGHTSFFTTVYMSGTTMFTLGLGDVVPHSHVGRLLTVLECGIGLGFVALVIGYLPVVSQAFSRREASIALLDARAGSPPTAVELLSRHVGDAGNDALVDLLRDWERWAAELLESHVSFPVLAFYRSQHDNQSWVAGMTALLDSCALILSIVDTDCRRQARLTFAMARHAVVDLCIVFRLERTPPAVDRLPAAEARRLETFLSAEGVRLRTDEPSIAKFRDLRAMYEPYVQALSSYLLMPLPEWLPSERESESWHAMA